MAMSSVLQFNSPPLNSQTISPPKPRCTAMNGISLTHFNKHVTCSLKLSSSSCISTSLVTPFVAHKRISSVGLNNSPSFPRKFTVFSAKGYKMKTHKASAKRFRVTGKGKIMRRRAGKQHLLAKKNTKRKLRLSKMMQVNRADYNNVIGALPYLKVNRNV